jgi:hypothetical protein
MRTSIDNRVDAIDNDALARVSGGGWSEDFGKGARGTYGPNNFAYKLGGWAGAAADLAKSDAMYDFY